MTASETYEALLSLEQIDFEIAARAAELEALSPSLVEGEKRLSELEAAVTSAEARAAGAEEALRKHERAAQAGRATLKRLQQRAQEVQNLKQHTAVRAETDAARRNLEASEDELLDTMQEMEEARGALDAARRTLAEWRDSFTALQAESDARRAELEAEIAMQRDRRSNRELRLEAKARRVYESVRGGRTRQVLAALTKDGVCGHCYTSVPKQRQAEVRAGRELYLCEGCGIILYPADD